MCREVELTNRKDLDKALVYAKSAEGMTSDLISLLEQATVSVIKEHHECLADDTQSYWEYSFYGGYGETLVCIHVNCMTEYSELVECELE